MLYFMIAGTAAVYTRWGRTSCPNTAQMVYKGIAGGTRFSRYGGGSNYLCLVEDPPCIGSGDSGNEPEGQRIYSFVHVHRAEYQVPADQNLNNFDVPCAVCRVTGRPTVLTVPGTTACPDNTWTTEYTGYIMANAEYHEHSSTFQCVDMDMEGIPGTQLFKGGSLFYHASSYCGDDQQCPIRCGNEPMTCVVCSK